jgi:hypothetical protein
MFLMEIDNENAGKPLTSLWHHSRGEETRKIEIDAVKVPSWDGD